MEVSLRQLQHELHQKEHFQDLLPRWESELQDTVTRASFLNEYGLRQWKKGELQPAMNTFKDAQSLFEKAGHRNGQATALANLARVQEAQASPEPAHQTWRNALVVFEETGHLPGIATALAGLGRTLLQSPHDRDLARDYLERAAGNFQQLHMEAEHQETSRLLQQLADGE